MCGCQFVVQFFLGLSLACLVGLHFLVIWAFCNRVSNLCFVSGCLFSRLKPLLRQGSLVLTPGGLLRTSRHFSEQVTRSLVPVGPHLFLCPPGLTPENAWSWELAKAFPGLVGAAQWQRLIPTPSSVFALSNYLIRRISIYRLASPASPGMTLTN